MKHHVTIRETITIDQIVVEMGQTLTVWLTQPQAPCGECHRTKPAPERIQVELAVDAHGIPRICLAEEHGHILKTFEETYPDQYGPQVAMPSEGDPK